MCAPGNVEKDDFYDHSQLRIQRSYIALMLMIMDPCSGEYRMSRSLWIHTTKLLTPYYKFVARNMFLEPGYGELYSHWI